MKILFISHHQLLHIGGVEKHVDRITKLFSKKGHVVNIVSEENIKYPKVKILGLMYIWFWMFKNRKLIVDSDVVHIHDVFIWYLPFKFIFPKKDVFITFHGWEGKYPIPLWNILNKKIASNLTKGSIAVGEYINKYYDIKSDAVIYGAVDNKVNSHYHKKPNSIIYLGRTDLDTGINEFKSWLKNQKTKYKVIYLTKSPNPEKYLKTAEYCVPAGYLSYLEAKSYGCKILTFANNPLKEDYWKEIKKMKSVPTWEDVVKVYYKLWTV